METTADCHVAFAGPLEVRWMQPWPEVRCLCSLQLLDNFQRPSHAAPHTQHVVTTLMLHRAAMSKVRRHVELVEWSSHHVLLFM